MDKIIDNSDIDTRLEIAKVTGMNVWRKVKLPELNIPTSPYYFRYFSKDKILMYIDAADYTFAVYKDIEPLDDGYWSPCYTTETWQVDEHSYAICGNEIKTPFMFAGGDQIISV